MNEQIIIVVRSDKEKEHGQTENGFISVFYQLK
jgi:hypothetical protein